MIEAAAGAAPGDPTPHLAALRLAAHTGTAAECRTAFAEVRARHPEHHHAHHLMAAVLADAAGEHEVYDFARDAAAAAPADSPLALLPLVAHAERFRTLRQAAGGAPKETAAHAHWSAPRGRFAVRSAFNWWLEWERQRPPPPPPRPQLPRPRQVPRGPAAPRPPPSSSASARCHARAVVVRRRRPYRAFRAARDAPYGAA